MQVREQHNLTIRRHTKGRIPTLPFVAIKEAILGKKYELSLLFPTLAHSKELHKTWKKKSGPVDVLAFALEKNEGEIVITLLKARSEASKYAHSYQQHLVYLFIHACLHLKGMGHGDKMEKQERRFMKKFAN